MRADMFKVIVERPRRGHHSAGKLKVPRDDRTKMPNGRGRGTKGLNENLKPLERFLRGNAGRPWSKVYAEICQGLSVRSAVQKHVRDHLSGLVDLRVFERDGELWTLLYKPRKLERGTRDILYVCPRTGLLQLLPALPHKLRAERHSEVTWVRPGEAAFVYRDQWWLVTVRSVKAFPVWDAFLERELDGNAQHGSWVAERLYCNRWIHAVARHALTSTEVAALGLKRK
jgi:hypothetical protein